MYDTELPEDVLSWTVCVLPGRALTSCTFERSTTPRGLTDSVDKVQAEKQKVGHKLQEDEACGHIAWK